jgi:hypothetical protein
MTESLPAAAVVRVALLTFDPALTADVDALNARQAEYLIPAIGQLPGLIHWYTGVSPDGTMAAISVWDSEEHARQMDDLKEMVVQARGEVAALVGRYSGSIVNYPVAWKI